MAARLGQAGAANQPTDLGQPQETSGGPAAAPDLPPGAQPAPGYRLERRLGRGGFGEVWRAAAPGGFPVALKLIPLDRPTAAAERRALELLKQVRHPHLLATVGLWEREGYLIVAMELADRTLADRLREATAQGLPGIPGEELLAYLAEAAQGLDYLNEPRPGAGAPAPPAVQHRDVKPHNLLLVGGSVKVGDFGLARHLEHSQASHSGGLTAAYAAPEFFQGRTSRHSDQYSLAVTYCELRGGRLPFPGDRAQVMHGHLHGEPDLSMLPDVERPVVGRALANAHAALGYAAFARGEEDRAIQHLTQALGLGTLTQKQHAEVRTNLARAYLARGARHAQRGDRGRAIQDWEQALRQDPKSALTHFHLGVIHAEQGDTRRALQSFDQALALNTLDPAQQEDARRRRDALLGANPPPP